MKYVAFWIVLSSPSFAFGNQSACAAEKPKVKIEAPCPIKKAVKPKKKIVIQKPVVAKPVVVIPPAPKPVIQSIPVSPKEPCCDKGKVETDVNNINVNRFNINVGKTDSPEKVSRVRYIERVRIKTETQTVMVSNPNRLMLLLGMSRTQPFATVDSCCTATAKTRYEPDLGLMYIRDFSSLSLGAAFTFRQSFYISGGFNF